MFRPEKGGGGLKIKLGGGGKMGNLNGKLSQKKGGFGDFDNFNQ